MNAQDDYCRQRAISVFGRAYHAVTHLHHGVRAHMRRFLLAFACFAGSFGVAPAQQESSPLDIFGYMQASFGATQGTTLVPGSSSFLLQQLNLMAARRFDSRFSMFVNLQFTNSYYSKLTWGSLNLEEAWARYHAGLGLNIKAGLLIPSFNALHQIKNRTPLLPYVFRPFVYEATLEDVVDVESFLPMRAYAEVYGTLPVGTQMFEYAVYVGNSDARFIASSASGVHVSGIDTSSFKLLGARLGLSNGWMRMGASITSDKENRQNMGIGVLQRFRFGGDLSVRIESVTLEGELILVKPQLGDREQATLKMLASMNPLVGKDFDKCFYYGTLLWDMTDEFFAYGIYSYLANDENTLQANGLKEWSVGGGWKPADQIVVKAQFVRLTMDTPAGVLDLKNYLFAVSVNF